MDEETKGRLGVAMEAAQSAADRARGPIWSREEA